MKILIDVDLKPEHAEIFVNRMREYCLDWFRVKPIIEIDKTQNNLVAPGELFTPEWLEKHNFINMGQNRTEYRHEKKLREYTFTIYDQNNFLSPMDRKGPLVVYYGTNVLLEIPDTATLETFFKLHGVSLYN